MGSRGRFKVADIGRVLPAGAAREVAADHGVCVRPVIRRVTDRETGKVEQLVIACGSTRESSCQPCAEKARRLRVQQCAEGWHLASDPFDEARETASASDSEGEADDNADGGTRRVRSTRRRGDAIDLPKLAIEDRSIGRQFVTSDGTTYRPSMFVTLTLGSYGPIVPGTGTPARPQLYDYR